MMYYFTKIDLNTYQYYTNVVGYAFPCLPSSAEAHMNLHMKKPSYDSIYYAQV